MISIYSKMAVLPCCRAQYQYCRRMSTQASLKTKWRKRFSDAGVSEPGLSADYIVDHVCGRDDLGVTNDRAYQIEEMCTLRLKSMPVQYIIGEWDFRNVKLKLRPPTLIPRPETEELVEYILNSLDSSRTKRFIDMGCGSGAIALSLLNENAMLEGHALDIAESAVQRTANNGVINNVMHRLSLYHSSILGYLHNSNFPKHCYDFIVSNPPYISTDKISSLAPEINKYEDHCALDGGENGMKVITQVLGISRYLLKPKGLVWLETDIGHDVKALVSSQPSWCLSHVQSLPDLTGRIRFHTLQLAESSM